MCTLVILRRPEHDWPVVIGANRDEMIDRPALPPGRHWPDRAEVVAGLDLEAGGSWLGVNDWGVAAAILNRHGSLGPAAGLRSRGELVLEALDHADVGRARRCHLDPAAYRSFNLIVADNRTGSGCTTARAGPRRGAAKDSLSIVKMTRRGPLASPWPGRASTRPRPIPTRRLGRLAGSAGDDTFPGGPPGGVAVPHGPRHATVSSALIACRRSLA